MSVSLLYTNNFDVWGIVEQFKTLHPLNLIPIFSQALGGILVGLVTKYAGSVRKGFSLIFGIALTGVVQSYIEGKKLGGNEKLVVVWEEVRFDCFGGFFRPFGF
ncbi:hypothetical protein TL16_g13413 [Triparma laevis f. inornata]|uniref:Uncharacterized protein n=1 Tax=Triparma laevis f. inornata TaxID=1714386 RepID=A0A9W7C5C4_9STRA|nr:hypothetical protein TL16_g13413 [Triparma laevis f. inornata]